MMYLWKKVIMFTNKWYSNIKLFTFWWEEIKALDLLISMKLTLNHKIFSSFLFIHKNDVHDDDWLTYWTILFIEQPRFIKPDVIKLWSTFPLYQCDRMAIYIHVCFSANKYFWQFEDRFRYSFGISSTRN